MAKKKREVFARDKWGRPTPYYARKRKTKARWALQKYEGMPITDRSDYEGNGHPVRSSVCYYRPFRVNKAMWEMMKRCGGTPTFLVEELALRNENVTRQSVVKNLKSISSTMKHTLLRAFGFEFPEAWLETTVRVCMVEEEVL